MSICKLKIKTNERKITMSLTTSEMTPADFAAVTGNNDSFGGNGAWWIIVLFLFMWGRGWGGFGDNGATPYATSTVTQADIQRGFDNAAVVSKLDSINGAITGGFATAELGRANAQANLMQALSGIAMAQQNCCCENRAAIADLKYTVATENCADRNAVNEGVRDIITAITAGNQSILDKLCQQEIDALKDRNAELLAQNTNLKFAQSQTAQNGFIQSALNAQTAILNPTPVPAYVVQNPNCCYNNNGGCGCG